MSKFKKAFTTIELALVIAVFGVLTVLFFMQKNTADAFARDDARKVAINSIFYTLEMVFYQEKGFYPEHIEMMDVDEEGNLIPATFPTLSPALLVDPHGRFINTDDSDFRYEPSDCRDGRCYAYRLSSRMEKEAEFVLNEIGENR